MNNQFKEAFINAMKACGEACDEESADLKREGRTDEANMKKAARNVYDLSAKVLTQMSTHMQWQKKMAEIQAVWTKARDLAAGHDDFARVAMEDNKLAALAEATARYEALRGEAE